MTFKSVFLLLGFLAICSTAQAQSAADVFLSSKGLTWIGLDFSKAHFIGDRDKLSTQDAILQQVSGWNALLQNEKDKYNIEKALYKSQVDYRLDIGIKHNEKLNYDQASSNMLSDAKALDKAQIQAIVSTYDFEGAKGTGMIMVVETFNKINEQAVCWVSFVDLGSGKLLFTERVTGKPKGFGLRNYWAGAIYQILKDIQKTHFDAWRKKYGKN